MYVFLKDLHDFRHCQHCSRPTALQISSHLRGGWHGTSVTTRKARGAGLQLLWSPRAPRLHVLTTPLVPTAPGCAGPFRCLLVRLWPQSRVQCPAGRNRPLPLGLLRVRVWPFMCLALYGNAAPGFLSRVRKDRRSPPRTVERGGAPGRGTEASGAASGTVLSSEPVQPAEHAPRSRTPAPARASRGRGRHRCGARSVRALGRVAATSCAGRGAGAGGCRAGWLRPTPGRGAAFWAEARGGPWAAGERGGGLWALPRPRPAPSRRVRREPGHRGPRTREEPGLRGGRSFSEGSAY